MADQEEKSNLTAKQEAFCQEYLVDLNATGAARRAGYSEESVSAIGWENLRKPEIQARISLLREELGIKNGNLAQRVINELIKVAFSNVQDYVSSENTIKDLSQIDLQQAAAISSMKTTTTRIVGAEKGAPVERETVEFKLWNKIDALEKIGKHLGIFEADNKQKSQVINVKVTDDEE